MSPRFAFKQCSLFTLLTIMILGLTGATALAGLKVGDAAPPIKVGGWVKGDAVTGFEPGKVYVMEFWATWCGPCVAAIPHISELQAKYKDKGVVVVGTSVWENEKDQAKVKPFVEKMGDKMMYNVAMDDRSGEGRGVMAETWLAAAGRNGIPCSFIVDQKGTIAWIGHPMQMGPVLAKVVAGAYDAKSAAGGETMMKQFQAAWRAGNKDEAAKIAEANLDAVKADAEMLNAVAWTLVDQPEVSEIQLAAAEKYAVAGVVASKRERGDILDTLAAVHFKKGEIDKAIEVQEEAVAKAGDDMRPQIQEALEKYKAAKK